jgi:anti-sigma factor RsiW
LSGLKPIDPQLLVHAYQDGELDVVSSLDFEQIMRDDPAVAINVDNVAALQKALREKLPPTPLPAELKSRIEAALNIYPARRPSWNLMAASVVLAVALSGGASWLVLRTPVSGVHAMELIDGHMRSLAASRPIDVASNDTHTVKPWFAGKTSQVPRTLDLSAKGFPLVGGRIDVIDRTAVPTLVYSKDLHLISLTSMVTTDLGNGSSATRTINGYNLVSWRDGGTAFWAISDLNIEDLNRFAKLFQE